MTTLHMETENVRSVAKQMMQTGEDTMQSLSVLNRSMLDLQSSWQGGGSQEFGEELKKIVSALNTQTELLVELAGRVEREAAEWEQADLNSLGGGLGNTAGSYSSSTGATYGVPSFFVGVLLPNLPAWIRKWLDGFFPQPPVISPIPDEPVVTPPQTSEENGKSKLGELMEKAKEEERKKAEQQAAEEKQKAEEAAKAEAAAKEKAAEQPKPAHIKDYPAREDDGTYLVGQEKNDSCAIASTKMVLHDMGIDETEEGLRKSSHEIDGGYHENSNWGTSPSSLDDLVNEKYGDKVTAEYTSSQTLDDLQKASDGDKGIVVSVKNSEWFGESNAHSVTVVGVQEVDGKKMVLVNDPWPPGEGKRLSVPAEDFERAWYGDAMYVSKK